MFDVEEFVTKPKTMLLAPAGYGKTYSIAKCLKYIQEKNLGKQLILTHTHAGIISIKEKLKKLEVAPSFFNVETISSFAQKYALSFCQNDSPNQDDSKNYYPFILKTAYNHLKMKPIRMVIIATYSGLFVDEYQDCVIDQHNLIMVLSELLPTHIVGDPLQGIFNFNGDLVALDDEGLFSEYIRNSQELETPWRWKNSGHDKLGLELKDVRNKLITNGNIDLKNYKTIESHVIADFYSNELSKNIYNILNHEQSLLFIDPISSSKNSRIDFIQRFKNIPILIESIDDKDFYKIANIIDNLSTEKFISEIKNILTILTTQSSVNEWFNDNGLKNKRNENDKILVSEISSIINKLKAGIDLILILDFINSFLKLPDVMCYRKDIRTSIMTVLKDAFNKKISVYEAMTSHRNIIRRVGRKIYGRCIGTTLLTKGLEFETVVLINAHNFPDIKNLYVALTRATKRLVIFSQSNIIPNAVLVSKQKKSKVKRKFKKIF